MRKMSAWVSGFVFGFKYVKKLKEAGFPLKKVDVPIDGSTKILERMAACFSSLEAYYFPTLEELIDAMPMRQKYLGTINDAHFQIWKLVSTNPKGEYRAAYVDENTNMPVLGYDFVSEGSPIEAVFNLWLSINQKRNDKSNPI